jgi:hypothetical protein
MLIGTDLAATGLVLPVMTVMSSTTAFPAHCRARAAADVAATLIALVSLAQHFLVAFRLFNRATSFEVLGIGLVVVRMMLCGRIVRNRTTLSVAPVMEALMTFHVVSPLRA